MMWKEQLSVFGVVGILLLPLSASAEQFCGNEKVSAGVRSCPDGSIPIFIANEVVRRSSPEVVRRSSPEVVRRSSPEVVRRSSPEVVRRSSPEVVRRSPQQSDQSPHQLPQQNAPATSDSLNLNYYFGVWHTRIPGGVLTTPSGYQGYDLLHIKTGVSTGDLIINPNGTYVWNSYGGKSGRWIRGDSDYPIVLIDTVENRHWRVGADPRRTGGRDIMVWDGKSISYDGRK